MLLVRDLGSCATTAAATGLPRDQGGGKRKEKKKKKTQGNPPILCPVGQDIYCSVDQTEKLLCTCYTVPDFRLS